jgi:hypothetical protein
MQTLVVMLADPSGVFCELHNIVQHCPILFRDWRSTIIAPKRIHKIRIQGDATQKLCVRFDSIKAPIRDGDNRRDHFLLPSGKRQIP